MEFHCFFVHVYQKKNFYIFKIYKTINNSEVISSQNILQENDILKIDVTSLEMNASIPYNKVSAVNNFGNSLQTFTT